MKVIPETLRAL